MANALIRGRVVDDRNRPVKGASIFVVSAPVSMPDIAQLTDVMGEFSLAAPVAGTYRIGIRATGFEREERDVKVASSDTAEQLIRMRAEQPS